MMAENTEQVSGTESFGEYMRRQRELRGFTLEEIAEQTKISLRALRALEAEDWEVLPAEVYIRGFVRCYAEVIGLDPNEAILRYEKAVQPYRKQRENVSVEKPYTEEGSPKRFPVRLVVIILLGILLIAAGIFLYSHHKSKTSFSTINAPALKGPSGFESAPLVKEGKKTREGTTKSKP